MNQTRSLTTIPRLALFDLDGTLVDSVPDLAAAVDEMLLQLGYAKAGTSNVRCWVGNGAEKLVRRALAHARHRSDDRQVGDNEAKQALEYFARHYRDNCCNDTVIYDGVLPLLNDWHKKGIPLAVVTNKPEHFSRLILNKLKLRNYFCQVVGGDSTNYLKPSPEPLLHVCHKQSIDARHSLMIGDSVNDVKAARAAGMQVACVTYGYNHGTDIRDANPDILVDSLQQLR